MSAKKPKKRNLSEEERKRQSDRMKALHLRWKAERAAAAERGDGVEQGQQQDLPREPTLAERMEAEFRVKQADLKPRPNPEQETLRAAKREEKLTAREDRPPAEVTSQRTSFERGAVDHGREVAIRKEELRREEWRKAIEDDEKRRGPNPHRNPRLPLLAASQTFRQPDISEIPADAKVPDGHAPKWVGLHDRLSTGKESMQQIREHQAWGYDYVRDDAGQPIVTEIGVLMSAPYEAAAQRQHHLTPQGSFKTQDSANRLREVADRENRRAGRRILDVEELPAHQRRFSDQLYNE